MTDKEETKKFLKEFVKFIEKHEENIPIGEIFSDTLSHIILWIYQNAKYEHEASKFISECISQAYDLHVTIKEKNE